MRSDRIEITDDDLHDHLRRRMAERGILISDIVRALNEGVDAMAAKRGTLGKTIVLPYGLAWEGSVYPEKEVTVYYKQLETGIVILTALARYGAGFQRGRTG